MRPTGWLIVGVMGLLYATLMLVIHMWSLDVGRGGLSPLVLGGDDGEYYLGIAGHIAITGQTIPAVTQWPVVVGRLAYFFGVPPVLVFKVIILLSGLAVLWFGLRLLDLVARDVLGSVPTAPYQTLAAGLLAFFPSVVFFGLFSLYRDAVIYAAFMACAYFGYRVLVRREPRLVGLIVSLGLLFALRWYAAVAFVAGTVGWVLLTGLKGRRKGRVLAATALGVLVLIYLLNSIGFFQNIVPLLRAREMYETVGGGSSLGVSFRDTSVSLWPAVYAYSFVSNAMGPLPFQISSASTLLGAVLEAPVIAYVAYRIVRGEVWRSAHGRYLVFIALAWLALIALYNDNIGTALRLRMVGMQVLFVLFVCELWARRVARQQTRSPLASAPRAGFASLPTTA